MKKLIILSAIALSGLIYSSANAQGRGDAGFRDRNDGYRGSHFSYRERPVNVQPVYYYDRGFDRFRDDRRAYPEYRHDIDTRYRGKR